MTLPPHMAKDILLIVLGGLFGWMLGQLPHRWVYAVMALAIALIVLVIK